MSVIRIPSKNIYEKENQKVIDNVISKVEVDTYEPQIINDTGNVYNDNVNANENGAIQTAQQSYCVSESDGSITQYYASYISIKPTYSKKKIKIPKNSNNARIVEILTGINDNSDTNIKLSIYGTVERGRLVGTAQISNVNFNQTQSGMNYFHIDSINITQKIIKSITNGAYTLFHSNEKYTNNYPYKPNGKMIAAELIFQNIDNVLTVTDSSTNEEEFVFNLIILTGIEILKPIMQKQGGSIIYPLSQIDIVPQITTITTFETSYYEIYSPNEISISFYGNIIGIDLQNETITIGNGNDVMSFSGNELIQTTNSPSLEEQYQAIINEWQNGKETATLRCSIDDYYDNDTNALLISANGNDTLPMTFKIGDIVIPYVYGANGQDKPMSTNADGTPKKFIVVGKTPLQNGAVWQEITLQEKTN